MTRRGAGSSHFAACCLLLAGMAALTSCAGDDVQPATTTGSARGELSERGAIEKVLSIIAVDPTNRADASTAKATLMMEREANNEIRRRAAMGPSTPDASPDRQVWLVEVRGVFDLDFRCQGLPATVCPHATPGPGEWLQAISLDGEVAFGTVVGD